MIELGYSFHFDDQRVPNQQVEANSALEIHIFVDQRSYNSLSLVPFVFFVLSW